MTKTLWSTVLALLLTLGLLPLDAQNRCGGTERWAVKVGTDGGASMVDVAHPATKTIHELLQINTPSSMPAHSDNDTRVPAERTVYVVDGRLLKFKLESGQTGDQDYHLIITDDSLQFTPGGSGSQIVPHSLVAEIVNPDCIPGKQGSLTTPSVFQAQIAAVRAHFNQQFPNITGGWNDANGIPVRITAVGFFDRDHGQTGRSKSGLELHPILDIVFNTTPV